MRDRDDGVRLAELMAAMSLGTDLGAGQPMEHVIRSCLLAVRLAERLGLDESERAVVYYVAPLAWVGCHADSTSSPSGSATTSPSSRDAAQRLHIAAKTVANHVEHIYTKIGVSTRAAASLFAMQHGLLDDTQAGEK